MFFLATLLLVGAFVGLVFGVVMSVWMWRTRPGTRVPAYRRSAPDHAGQYPGPLPVFATPPRQSVDGRRRDLRPVSM